VAATAPNSTAGVVPRTRRSRRRRSATVVLSFAVVFVLLQVAFHYPATEVCPQLRDNIFGRKWARLREVAATRNGTRPLVVMTGSSLTEMGFRPSEMPGQDGTEPGRPVCYNLGLSGCGVVVQLLTLHRILEGGIRPDLVLIECSPFFLYTKHSAIFDGDVLPPERMYWGDWPTLDRNFGHTSEYRRRWRERQYLPWSSYRSQVQHWIDPDLVTNSRREARRVAEYPTMDEWGFADWSLKVYKDPTGYHLNGRGDFIRAHFAHFYIHAERDVRLAEAYREMVALCRDRGIRYALVLMPESSFVAEGWRPTYETNEFTRLLARFKREYGTEVIDARDWAPDDDFTDGCHLRPDGAARFSQRLERDVLRRIFPPSR